ncbi:NAD binding domain of 6-phosphogluconate dehydrogenase-domain-containing protein [Catenaria anguillulae PL171]|uniref:3-hydroxyisobutyrate dehydrogenase n=1 Tax=Catenaria anguillulae PL171 TaxID=765915 RepID=A0A1Y2I5Y0_9FUNG|nr:NAD binding domain of 6-phosphogluconate dehydrogenase-domain-containing protein [Catenaria anguillulae PL171]
MISASIARQASAAAGRRFYSSSATAPVIGFIGLGQMGLPMATNLYTKSRATSPSAPFLVYDVVPQAVTAFTSAHKTSSGGAVQSVDSIAALARQADVIVTMLPTSAHVKQVYMTDLLPNVRPGTLLIDSSTIDPAVSKLVANALIKDAKCEAVDAPVSGGFLGAQAGTLTFMVGGDRKAFERARPLLQHMGKNIVHCGEQVGTGQVAKICNNMILGSTMVAVSEAMNLGVKLGMDPKLLAGIVNSSSGRCWSSDTYNPVPGVMEGVPSARGYEGGFGITLMQKDMGLALAAAESVKAPVPMAAAADNVFKNAMTVDELKKKDMSVVYQWLAGTFTKMMGRK